ncbi:MAG: NAAT family transporter [Candidatus Altiarchaeota archaeon]|nr:NAAT family transporter [Candidatus Altiarchaeota archaeon]
MVEQLLHDPLSGDFSLVFAIKSFVALFVIVDAIGIVPIYMSLLSNYTDEDKRAMVRMAVRIAAMVLLVMTLIGNLVFRFLGVEIFSFKIAGGIVLLIISIEMLFGRRTRMGFSDVLDSDKEDIAVMPMAVPLLTGPGAITTGIILFEEAGVPINKLALMVNILLVFLVSYQIFKRLDLVYKVLGRVGTKVATRIMGLMLAAISVQFIISGIADAITSGIIG